MKQESRFGAHIGTSSLLLIFLTLSLVSFGSLSLAGAKADERLSVKLSEHTAEYYAACHEAEAFVARTDSALSALFAEDPASFSERAQKVPMTTVIPLNDTQELFVALEPADPAGSGGGRYCRVIRWKVDNKDEESYERHLPVSESGGMFK